MDGSAIFVEFWPSAQDTVRMVWDVGVHQTTVERPSHMRTRVTADETTRFLKTRENTEVRVRTPKHKY